MLRGSLPPVKQQWFNLYGGGLVHMGCPTLVPLIELPLPSVISTFSRYGPGLEIQNQSVSTLAATTWPVVNGAQLYEITLPSEYTVRFFRWSSGVAVAGNYDIGLYDNNFSLLRSVGSTPHPGATFTVEDAITPLNLQPGSYWLAFASDSIGFGILARAPLSGPILSTEPVRGALASFPLPATITATAAPFARLQPIAISNLAI